MIMPENANSAFSKIYYLSTKLEFGPIVRHLGKIPINGTDLCGIRSKYTSAALRSTRLAQNTDLLDCVVQHALKIPIYCTVIYCMLELLISFT